MKGVRLRRTSFKNRGKPIAAKTPMRKRSKKREAYRSSAEGKAAMAYMGKVKQLPCCVCGAPPPSDAHHVIHDRFGTRKSSDFDVIALCKKHHQDGPDAIHNGKETWRAKYGPDHGYIEATKRAVRDSL